MLWRQHALIVLLAASMFGACGSDSEGLPEPVDVALEPGAGNTLGDPSFEALPGATAHFGRLHGAAVQIEIPDDWNRQLVMYLHAYRAEPELPVDAPPNRQFLVENGYAWAATSYSSSVFLAGSAADETAALWDEFAREFERPERSYVMGFSLGGGGAAIAMERYADRFDGGVAFCAVAGTNAQFDYAADFVAVGAFVAGVSQAEFDSRLADPDALITDIRAAISAPEPSDAFERLVIALTGGTRLLGAEGLDAIDDLKWAETSALLAAGLLDNRDHDYTAVIEGGGLGDEFREFPSQAVRMTARLRFDGQDFTGELKAPLLTVHNTGDGIVPLGAAIAIRHAAQGAGAEEFLVQRTIRSADHCDFTMDELRESFDALVAWVVDGRRPGGEDPGAGGETLGERFTDPSR